jgi:hypothetical protein
MSFQRSTAGEPPAPTLFRWQHALIKKIKRLALRSLNDFGNLVNSPNNIKLLFHLSKVL